MRIRTLLSAIGCTVGATLLPGVKPGIADENERLNLQIAMGSATKRLCSSVLVGGRDAAHVFSEELDNPLLEQITFEIDADVVRASLGDMSSEALYRPRLGCTLVVSGSTGALRAQFDTNRLIGPAEPDDTSEWPTGSRVTLPTDVAGIDMDAIRQAVVDAFDDMEPDQQIRTRAVLVVHQGRIIAERYADGFSADMPQLGWSMNKTITAALSGMLEADGRLDFGAPAAVPEWQTDGDPRAAITLRQLMQMASGLAFSEVYTAGSMSDVIRMLYTTGDTAGFAAAQTLAHTPGTHFSYASGTTNIISRLQRDSFSDPYDYLNYPHERLFRPLGMSSAIMEPDESGVYVGSSYIYATPRDWARFAQLYLQDGAWNGVQLLPEGFVQRSVNPGPASPLGNYGYQLWLNAGAEGDSTNRPMPALPESMYYLSGFEGQNILVFPEHELIVMRMGLTTSGPRPVWRLAERVLEALQ